MRRHIALLLAVVLSLPVVAFGDQILHWTMLGGTPTHEGMASAFPQPPLEITWKTDLGMPCFSAPLTDGEKIFLGGGRPSSSVGAYYCLDYANGKIIWKHTFGGSIPSTPVISANRVWAPCYDGHIYGRDIAGSEVFSTLIKGKGGKSSGVDNATSLFFCVDGDLLSVDAYSGAVNWQADFPSSSSLGLTAYAGMVYVMADDGHVYAFNDSSGVLQWKFRLDSPPSATPMVLGDDLIVPTNTGLCALHLAFEEKELRYEWKNGSVGKVSTMPSTDGNQIFFGTESGKFYAFDGQTGNMKWSYNAGFKVSCSPVFASGKVAFGCEDGNFQILDVDSGTLIESVLLPAAPTAQPLAFWDRIIVTCTSGLIVCLGPKGEPPVVPPPPPVDEEVKPQATIKIDAPDSAILGNKTEIAIALDDADNVVTADFTVVFDGSKLDYIDYKNGGMFGQSARISQTVGDGEVVFKVQTDSASDAITGDGIVVILTFIPNEPGTHRLSIVDARLLDKDAKEQDLKIVTDSFEVKAPKPGVEVKLYPESVDLGKIYRIVKTKLRLTQKNGDDADYLTRTSSDACSVNPKEGNILGTGSVDIEAVIDPERLSPGKHEITVSVNIIGKTLRSMISLEVPAKDDNPPGPPPCIQIDPAELDFGYIPRGREISIDFTLTLDVTQEISGKIESDKKWLRVSPATFKTKGGVITGIATIAASELPGGSEFIGTLHIVSSGKVCKDVTVMARVKTQPSIVLALDVGVKKATIGSMTVDLDQAPRIRNSRTLVPIRFVSESFGCKVQWEAETKKVTINRFNDTIVLWVGKRDAVVNGKFVTLDIEPSIEEGGTLVPIRFISQAFGAVVEWFHDTKHIRITYTPPDDY